MFVQTARSFLRTHSFTVTAVLSLMLGIGAATAIYSLVDQVLLHSLPVRQPPLVSNWIRNSVHIELQNTKVRQQKDYDESSQNDCDYPKPVSSPEFLDCLLSASSSPVFPHPHRAHLAKCRLIQTGVGCVSLRFTDRDCPAATTWLKRRGPAFAALSLRDGD